MANYNYKGTYQDGHLQGDDLHVCICCSSHVGTAAGIGTIGVHLCRSVCVGISSLVSVVTSVVGSGHAVCILCSVVQRAVQYACCVV